VNAPQLTVHAIRTVAVEMPMNYAPGTSAANGARGTAVAAARPGNGLSWNADAVTHYRLQ